MPEYPAHLPHIPVLAARPVPCFPRTKRPSLLPAWSLTGPERPVWMQGPLMMFPDHYRASDSLRRTVRRVVSPLVLGCLGDTKYHPKVIHHKVAGWPSRRCHVSCLSSFWLKLDPRVRRQQLPHHGLSTDGLAWPHHKPARSPAEFSANFRIV